VHKPEPEAAGQPEGDAGDGPLRLAIPKFTMMMLPTVASSSTDTDSVLRALPSWQEQGANPGIRVRQGPARAPRRGNWKMPGSCHSRGSWRRGHVTSSTKPGFCSTLKSSLGAESPGWRSLVGALNAAQHAVHAAALGAANAAVGSAGGVIARRKRVALPSGCH
jgi:hypothetical protein